MLVHISKKLSNKFKKFSIEKIEGGASKKKFYRLGHLNKKYILTDFYSDKKEYRNNLIIYNLLKNINISVPKIIEKYDDNLMVISEDFGDLRFDKILQKYPLKDLLHYAVDTLIVLKNSIQYDPQLSLAQYNFNIFKEEIFELPKYYFPHINLDDKNLNDEFIFIWSEAYKNIQFEFNTLVHKDFNINNLILISNTKKHLKCGVIDFQNAFWGESSWDLFSLLEDSRVLFTDEFNEYFIKYFFSQTSQNTSIQDFLKKYYFLNSSRQTRLLGRWIKLSKELKQDWYLDFIPITLKRLKKSIKLINDEKLTVFYNKYIFD
jgi:aminoglycoside/choline kinase family phosphotransferase